MKSLILKFFLVAIAIFTATSNVAFAKQSPDELRAKLNQMSQSVLERMEKAYPESVPAAQKSYAYCTISCSSVKLGFWGTDRGRGVAVNNETGEKIYVHMDELSVGVNFGAKEYDLLFVITNKKAWDSFVSGKIKLSTEVSAQASDGVTGGTFADATIVADGVWVYQVDKKGLAVELSFKGAQIKPIKELHPDKYKK